MIGIEGVGRWRRDVRITKTTKDRLYHVGEVLFAKRNPIVSALRDTQARLLESSGGIVLYDVTNTHFEGISATAGTIHVIP